MEDVEKTSVSGGEGGERIKKERGVSKMSNRINERKVSGGKDKEEKREKSYNCFSRLSFKVMVLLIKEISPEETITSYRMNKA